MHIHVKNVIIVELTPDEYRAIDDALVIATASPGSLGSDQSAIVSRFLISCREEWAKE